PPRHRARCTHLQTQPGRIQPIDSSQLGVPPQPDTDEVARCMARLLDDGHAYAGMRQAAHDTQRRFFNTALNHRRLAELLASL
ncbi:hypothetical protein J3Q32_05620, partial [Bordetella holmesii]|nr:hypothetical protein [Bordetella holmesii]